ncbi:hypothetical protein [Polaromonas sp.]|uniref:hypothetical protein n=1 Tax=Polaromonas sp. TaxID=1869339 RepID=UPI0024884AA3|nr:hypothetical protein [Polaromonas sp.]MDI1273988.1 hypothetical protein [Polaromonas sp.]
MVAASQLDAALMASIGPRWAKVAMVLGRAAKVPGLVFAEDEDEYETLAERLEELVAFGHVLAEGDLKEWRFSEVRLPVAEGVRGEL